MFFQISMVFLIILAWNMLFVGFELQKEEHYDNISSSPMIILSMQEETLIQLKDNLDTYSFIENITIIQDSVIAQTLIREYDLEQNTEILSSYILPTAMELRFKGEEFNELQKKELERTLLGYSPSVIYYHDNASWEKHQNKLLVLTKGYITGFGFCLIFTIFISIFLRIHFAMKSSKFWKIYYSAGGYPGKRKRQFLFNTLLLCTIPIILNLLAYYTLRYFNLLKVAIDFRLFVLELITLIFSYTVTRIILRKSLK
ncbi:MAG: hypothetical protein K9N07_01095 [Candidatus Cloacimonetes bacterium]|nr:hypothetical protein [Candidatus Cloacimonadota bacterium]